MCSRSFFESGLSIEFCLLQGGLKSIPDAKVRDFVDEAGALIFCELNAVSTAGWVVSESEGAHLRCIRSN